MRPLLALAVLLLAGCASGGHEGHEGMQAIVGVRNVGEEEAGFRIDIRGPVGSGPMEYVIRVGANQTAERLVNVTNDGVHRVTVSWGAGRMTDAWDTYECPYYHIVVTIDPREPEERASERQRECH